MQQSEMWDKTWNPSEKPREESISKGKEGMIDPVKGYIPGRQVREEFNQCSAAGNASLLLG